MQDQIDPDLFQKLQEFLNSNNKEQLLQSVSSEEFEQLFMLARHLKKQQAQNNDQMNENELMDEESEEMAMRNLIDQFGLDQLQAAQNEQQSPEDEHENQQQFDQNKQGQDDHHQGIINPRDENEGETESAFNAKTQQKHQ